MARTIEYFKTGWKLLHDADNTGLEKNWQAGIPEENAVEAEVPSFVHMYLPDCYGVAWYQYRFTPQVRADEDHVLILKIGMADFLTKVYVNGEQAGEHWGSEDPFSFDVSALVRPGEENLLVVRVSKPYSEDVDGYSFKEIPHRNQMPTGMVVGWCYNEFGLSGEVSLHKIPKVSVEDAFIYGNVKTGQVEVEYTLENRCGEEKKALLKTICGNKRSGEEENRDEIEITLAPGKTLLRRTVQLEDVRLWDIDDPNLYFVHSELLTEKTAHMKKGHCGFRTFEVGEDGYFRLNGRRIFLKSAHTGNCMPESVHHFCRDKSFLRKDVLLAKNMGLNTMRFISGVALPEQLDYCDEVGMMVYEEPASSWCQETSPRAKEYYQQDLFQMMRRDRNHPSVTIWGFLNETQNDERHSVCLIARNSLEEARQIDPTRLILYSSGRWDGDVKVGSVCNPFEKQWQALWNEEGKDLKTGLAPHLPGGFVESVGDVHCYPREPVSDEEVKMFRTLGSKAMRPVFYSEMGLACLFDVIWLKRKFEQWKSNPELPDVKLICSIADQFEAAVKQYGFDQDFAFPIDIFRESQKRQCRYRTSQFNIIRSNPHACGYNLTGMLDHGITAEGLFTFMREWKPGLAETIEGGFAPLRWCLFASPMHVYSGQEFEIEGVLANEDVLEAREYPIEVKISGKDGAVFAEKTTLKVTEEDLKYMAVPVFKKKITLNVPEGEYELRAEILEGAAAFDGRLTFFISEDQKTCAKAKKAVVYGLGDKALALLHQKGVETCCLCQADENEKAVVLLGDIEAEKKEAVWKKLRGMMAKGSRVFAASRYAFEKDGDYEYHLPLEEKPENKQHSPVTSDWLYHKEYLAKRGSRYFENMPTGMLHWDYYMHLISGHQLDCAKGGTPDTVEAACFGTGIPVPTGYEGGVNLGTYKIGEGALTICTYNLLAEIGKNPAADRLLINAVNAETEKL